MACPMAMAQPWSLGKAAPSEWSGGEGWEGVDKVEEGVERKSGEWRMRGKRGGGAANPL